MDRSVRFYENLLGFSVATKTERISALNMNGVQVPLIFKKGASVNPIETPGGVIPPNDGDGCMHAAFSIPTAEVEAWESSFLKKGVAIESKVTWEEGGVSLYFWDPDRNLIELKTTAWDGKELDW